jgi:indolepyruvate ferredoxin oxidoreductase
MLSAARSAVVVNTHAEMPPSFIRERDFVFPGDSLLGSLEEASQPDGLAALDATRLAAALLGDSIGANVLMLGFAFQRGQLPVSGAALYRALELYGRNVEENKLAFDWGRFAAESPAEVEKLATAKDGEAARPRTLPELIAHREKFLASYQDGRYAERYRRAIARVAAVEYRLRPDSTVLQEAVARHYFTVLAYKDEYEVARLHTETEFAASVRRGFGSDVRMSFNFSPPLFAKVDPSTGRPKKYEFGPWIVPVLRLLARMRRVRGTWFDPFARTADRLLDRAVLERYEAALERIVAELDAARFDLAVELACLPDQVRGYGPVKRAAAITAERAEQKLWERWATAHAVRRPVPSHASAA